MKKIGVFVGSIRKEAFSKKIATNVVKLLPEDYEAEFIQMDHLPFYNQDFDDERDVPEPIVIFREKMKTYDGFIFVIPEYNRSLPAIVKNAIDIGSRPKPENVWNEKPAAIISQSPGSLGAFGANHHLRQTLTAVNMPVVQHPEVYISNAADILDENGNVHNEDTIKFLQSFIDEFIRLMSKFN